MLRPTRKAERTTDAMGGTGKDAAPTTEADIGAARQRGRGREATKPSHLPRRAWKEVLGRVIGSVGRDRVMLIAAGVTFYLLLALVPSLTAFVAIYGLFADQATVLEHVRMLSGIVPADGLAIIEEQLRRLAGEGTTTLSWTVAISLIIALWSASAGIKAMFEAMNIAYHEEEDRGFIKISALGLAFALGFAAAAALALVCVILLPAILTIFPLAGNWSWLVQLLGYLVLLAVLVLALAALYRWGPARERARWRWITPGAAFAVVMILLASAAFSFYVANFGNYNATYGSLGALIGLLTWMWISVSLVILGAELNAEIEHQTAQDTTTGEERPLGERGAYVADTVG